METKHFESLYPDSSREKEIAHIVSYIQEGNSSQVVGLSGVGRSTLLGLLSYNHGVHLRHFPTHHSIIHFVMVNFSEIKNRQYGDLVKFLFLSLVSSMKERQKDEEYETLDALFKKSLSYQDELVLTEDLKRAIEYLCLERKLTIIFLFDRFDQYIPQVSPELFILLRSLRDKAKYRFSVIFSLERPLEDIVDASILQSYADYVVGHHIYLSLEDRPSIEFRIDYLEKVTKKKLSDSQRKEILFLTGGHLRLVKTSLEALFAQSEQTNDLKTFLLSHSGVKNVLLSIWNELSPVEHSVLLGRENTQESHVVLERLGLIKEGKVQIPLLESFITQENLSVKEDEIMYDQESNLIKRGDTILSYSLTKSEFRLLRYLLQHKGEVVGREELINAVWKDEKSLAGVSEQALDQLLFRLRRKIERDPNNPSLLQTIKGHGVQFSS